MDLRISYSTWNSDFNDGLTVVMECLPNLDATAYVTCSLATMSIILFYLFNYGRENENFINYHLNRTCCCVAFFKCIPSMCCQLISGYLFDAKVGEYSNAVPMQYWKLVRFFVNLLAIVTCLKVLKWKYRCRSHPLIKNIEEYVDDVTPNWQILASKINEEYRSSDTIKLPKTCCSQSVFIKNWFIRINLFTVCLIGIYKHFELARVYPVDDDGSDVTDGELATIKFAAIPPLKLKYFKINLSLDDYQKVSILWRRQLR